MFRLQRRGGGEQKEGGEPLSSSPPFHGSHDAQPLTQRRSRVAATAAGASTSASALPSPPPPPFLPPSLSPSRVSRLNFLRLLSRVERRVEEERAQGRAEAKEPSQSVKRQTALLKALQSLRAQLEALGPSLEARELSSFAQRLSRQWADVEGGQPAAVAPVRLRTLPLPSPPPTAAVARPSLPLLSSSSAAALLPASSLPSSAPPQVPPSASAHPLADAAHFPSHHLRASPPNPALLRAELLSSSAASSSPAPAPASSSLRASHEAALTALSVLAPALKEQVTAIAAHLKVDEAVVADSLQGMDANVERVTRENVRLRGWARASCGETCWMTAVIALTLAAFAVMVVLMKLIPKPR